MSEVGLQTSGVTVIQNNPHLALYGRDVEDSRIWVNHIVLEKETGNQLIVVRFENPPGI